jgi:hypothetical protein
MADFDKAVRALYANVVTINGETAYDADGNEVTIDMTQVNAWQNPDQYKYDRQQAYKPLAEQLDMMYHDKVNGTTTWQDHIDQVKADNPKPTE